MNEDYLWDKTGTDPEIERLEHALAAFRSRENAPPALPAKARPFRKESARNALPFIFAAAACAAFAMILFGAWLQNSRVNPQPKTETAEATPPGNLGTPNNSSIEKPANSTIPQPETPTAKAKVPKFRKNIGTAIHQNKTVARTVKSADEKIVGLTKEEKHAYDQLMLALSITSSKLNLVKNKIEGAEQIQKNER